MPNWVFNEVIITGSKEDVERVREQVGKPFSIEMDNYDFNTKETKRKTYTFNNPVFSFYNIVSPDDLEAYAGQANMCSPVSLSDPNWWVETEKWRRTQKDWYNWNCVNWGTKWDVANHDDHTEDSGIGTIFYPISDTEIKYKFDTAWSPPVGALASLSTMFPNIVVVNDWQEEQGFGSTLTFKKGNLKETGAYDYICAKCDKRKKGKNGYREDMGESLCNPCYKEIKAAQKKLVSA